MPQEMNIYTFRNPDLETLRETLIKGFQHPFFDVEKRMFGSKESFDTDIPRIPNRKERRRLKAKDKRKKLSKSKEKAIDKINQAISLIEPYFEGNPVAKKFTLKWLEDAIKELED